MHALPFQVGTEWGMPPTGSVLFKWLHNDPGGSGPRSAVVQNVNDLDLTLVLDPWEGLDGPLFAWVTVSPVTIPAHSSATLQVSTTGYNVFHRSTALGLWSLAGGASGTIAFQAQTN